LTEIRI